ncbi:hypothetical protein E8E12_006964 [Didymella heteroderae]|uniref:Uncharacterized protein n=1 Tax=Didymella heteroderae TaxID=1769908 RepID=A0A9P4WPB3_9PLEO|nr:hypothetical protein E8E12_006964 [Didymella heteroderae]
MGPLPYSIRWTAKLICRDLKGLAASCTSKAHRILSSTSGASDRTVSNEREDTFACAPSHRNEVENEPLIDAEGLRDGTSPCTASSPSSGTESNSPSTLPINVSEAGREACVILYCLLSQKLKDLYASRERDLSLVERWTFRGACLLHTATQYCASNLTYGILNPGSSSLNETALLLEILRRYISFSKGQWLTWLEEFSTSETLEPSTSRVSQTPMMPFTKTDATSRRHDSVYDTLSMERLSNPTSALLWYTIFLGATDRTKMIQAAEYLLGHVWPEKDASALLEIVGDPAKQLPEDYYIELRKELGPLLYPGHNAPC